MSHQTGPTEVAEIIGSLFGSSTQCRELPLCAGSGKGCQWQALPSPMQCEETATRTRDLPVTGGKALLLAPGLPFCSWLELFDNLYWLGNDRDLEWPGTPNRMAS